MFFVNTAPLVAVRRTNLTLVRFVLSDTPEGATPVGSHATTAQTGRGTPHPGCPVGFSAENPSAAVVVACVRIINRFLI